MADTIKWQWMETYPEYRQSNFYFWKNEGHDPFDAGLSGAHDDSNQER